MTVGSEILKNQELEKSVDQLVGLTQQFKESITGVRPASSDSKKDYESLMADFASLRGRPLFYPYIGSGTGRGPYVELCDGSVKLDFINGIGVHIFGHGHPAVTRAAVRGALSDIVMQGHLQMNQDYLNFGSQVLKMAEGSRLKHGWISPSGSMANENALKMARQKNSPARKIIAMEGAFAGRTTMMAEVTDNPNYKIGLPEYNEVLRVPFFDKHDPKSSEKALGIIKEHIKNNPGDISCFCFEPMLGEGGYKVAPKDFFCSNF